MTDVRFVDAEVLRLAPDEVLLIHIRQEWEPEMVEAAVHAFERLGIGDRVCLIDGEDVGFTVVPQP